VQTCRDFYFALVFLLLIHVLTYSYILGDKTILKDAGLEGMRDVEDLPPPP
jgi:hypothetical protein